MHKINTTGATVGNEFTDGDIGTGTPSTIVDAAWLNSVQRELIAPIEDAGITLDPDEDNQLLLAIRSVALRAVYHVGSIYANYLNDDSPSEILGFGTWSRIEAFIAGRSSSGTGSFGATGATGGAEAHDHGGNTQSAVAPTQAHTHSYRDRYHAEKLGVSTGGASNIEYMPGGYNNNRGSDGSDTDNDSWLFYDSTTGSTGGSTGHAHGINSTSHLPPYTVINLWKRTA